MTVERPTAQMTPIFSDIQKHCQMKQSRVKEVSSPRPDTLVHGTEENDDEAKAAEDSNSLAVGLVVAIRNSMSAKPIPIAGEHTSSATSNESSTTRPRRPVDQERAAPERGESGAASGGIAIGSRPDADFLQYM